MPRPNNETYTTDNVLLALSVVAPANTALATVPGTVLINDDSELTLDTATWPALLIEEGEQSYAHIHAQRWQKKLEVFLLYMARADQDGRTEDQVWAAVAADVELLIANLTDNPTLTCTLPGAGSPTRNCLEIAHIQPSPRTAKAIDRESYSVPVVQRLIKVQVNLPAYVTAA